MSRRSRELPRVVARIIPKGTRCHLWNMASETITKEYFITQDDLEVLVMEGHGPLYGALKDMVYGPKHARDIARQIPLLGHLVPHGDAMNQAISLLAQQHPGVEAILMAKSQDGKVGILFLDEGIAPDLDSLE